MRRGSTLTMAALLLVGCKTGEQPVRGANPGSTPTLYAPPTPSAAEPVDAPRPERGLAEVPTPQSEASEKPKRDLAAELSSAIGVPTDCVRDFTASTPTKIRVTISATVRPTGMIILPSAYGNGLSVADRRCIEERVGNVVLRPIEEPMSQIVSTYVDIDYTPEVILEADPGVPEPKLRNVVEPLPKRPDIPPSGLPIQKPTPVWISGGFDGGVPIEGPAPKKISGPKPIPIDGYEVVENAQEWR